MPVFHTKTIESTLEPVAQQVSRLVIIHEEGEAGHEMPDLSRAVHAVSKAVTNLVEVGHEMVSSTDDKILRQDMPTALVKVESAAKLLEEAAMMSSIDPYSKPARSKLIEGSRWILQGTSNVLMVYDESEVRKILVDCKRILDYLAVAEVIESLEDLIQFVRNLSPCLAKVTKDVERRIEDLTHQIHREILTRCVEQLKTFAPILICSMKIFIQILTQGGKGVEEAAENRNYLASRMSDEVGEMMRVLQLTTYDEDEWDSDNLAVMRKSQAVIESKLQLAYDWLKDPTALLGGVGEKSVRNILGQAIKVADRSLPLDSNHLRKLSGDIQSMTDALCEMRHKGDGTSASAETLARNIESRLNELYATVNSAIGRVEKSGIQQPSPTVAGRLEQARRWLEQPATDDRGLGRQAIFLVVDEGNKIADVLPSAQREEVLDLCRAIEQETQELTHLCREGQGDSVRSFQLAKNIATNLGRLKDAIQTALVDKVVEDFLDTDTPLRQLIEIVEQPPPVGLNRDRLFEEKAKKLADFSDKVVRTSKMVAVGTGTGNKKVAESILSTAVQVESLTPQLINAGRIGMVYPDNKSAHEHFDNLQRQFGENLQRLRGLCDVATDSKAFIEQSFRAMERHTGLCEDAIQSNTPIKLVENTSSMIRLANRVLQVAKQEMENSEDPNFIALLNNTTQDLHAGLTPVVQSAKAVATNITHQGIIQQWRKNNQHLLECVLAVQDAVSSTPSDQPPLPPYPDISDLSLDDGAPPRPPLPSSSESSIYLLGRPRSSQGPDTTDDESDDVFHHAPTPSQGPIMMAAHELHQEVKQWSSKDNDVIVAAKKMALLMAKLSQLVGEDSGSKRELITCAKAIAESSDDVTRIAKELARDCTDKRMRTTLLQVCERIPTIATQLKILSTVKATMLGAQGTKEDREATEMLVGNAQNLMLSVKQTVMAAESATIKIRTDAGIRLRWIRKQPWYQY